MKKEVLMVGAEGPVRKVDGAPEEKSGCNERDDEGAKPTLWAWLRLRSETTATGICPAISGATPIFSVLRVPGQILKSLSN